MESDWRKFRDMVPHLRERYLAGCNARIARIIADPKRNETERFWDALEEMEKQAKILRQCLDGHSRSSMFSFMCGMLSVGMLTKEDLLQFSEELQQKLSVVV
jgi:hypothetical protein